MDINMTIIVIAMALAIIALFPFVVYELARKKSWFFTTLETGNIKYIYRGDTLIRVIADIPGEKVAGEKGVNSAGQEYGEFELTKGERKKDWWEKRFGLYWVGIPPFSTVKYFKISKKRSKDQEVLREASDPKEWIEDKGLYEVDSLLAAFPRPFAILEVELGDRQTVNLLLATKTQVVDTYKPVPELKGNFFDLMGSLIRAATTDVLGAVSSMDDFIKEQKADSGKSLLKSLVEWDGEFNESLKKQVGLKLVGIAIDHWDPSDLEVRKAMNAKFIAIAEGEARIATADAYAQAVVAEANAEATAQERLATARGVRIRETAANLASATMANPDEVARTVGGVLEAEAIASPDSKVTTFVKGNAGVVLPTQGGNS